MRRSASAPATSPGARPSTLKIVVGARPSADTGVCIVTPAIARSPSLEPFEQRGLACITVSHACSAMNAAAPPMPAMISNALRCPSPTVRARVVGGPHPVGLDAVQQLGLQHEHAGVRPVPLVRRRDERVDAPAVDVDREVRRPGHRVDVQARAGRVRMATAARRSGAKPVRLEAPDTATQRLAPRTRAARSARSSVPSTGSTGRSRPRPRRRRPPAPRA